MTNTENVLKPLKTWSYLAGNRKRPSEYEIVTVNIHGSKSYLNKRPPFELSPELPMNAWYVKHRDETPLKHTDWNLFRDPDELIYRGYNILQDGQETYVEGLFDEFDSRNEDAGFTTEWRDLLARFYTPSRYPFHALQMASAYVGQVAPASTITNSSYFQAGDCLRLLSHTAYRTRELANAHPDAGFGGTERATWENDPCWQGMRELLEKLLTAYDWSDAFIGLCIVSKPAVDECLMARLGAVARRHGDSLLGMLTDAQLRDSDRSKRWSRALLKFIAAEDRNLGHIETLVRKWLPLAEQAVSAYCLALPDGEEHRRAAIAGLRDFIGTCGVAA